MSGVSSSVQFRSSAAVIQAYNDRGVEAWSIWQGKQFMTKGMGVDELQAFISMLSQSESTAIYTIKIFEDVDDVRKIKSGTEHDGSFNFRLYERDENGFVPNRGSYGLDKRLDALEDKINEALESRHVEKEIESEPAGVMGAVIGLLQDPDKLEKLIHLGKSLLGQPAQPAYIGNVNRAQDMEAIYPANSIPVSEDQKLQRLGVAIDTLEKNDPLLVDHLEKLAAISSTKPDQFKMLVGMLDLY